MAVSVVAKFIADEWFKIMMILCFVLFVLSLSVDLRVDNGLVCLFSLSGLLWGIGEMACRPYREILVEGLAGPGWGTVSGRPRQLNAAGIVLFLLSFAFAALGCLRGWPIVAAMVAAI
ncbi:hypothetical protein N0B28_13475 [Pseudomonas sp. SD17-1]|uniref:hypothetical protein n=1 Tax=Pseudomonas sp. SD17-1 TaxID=2976883 RepID=UPI0023DC147C|nr:hypothetical protein [Pseudomonas sp. SD17-1]WEJ19315.1 hypothetical protein N0B28_13475 [Pseudomonas sp. SD17-1]